MLSAFLSNRFRGGKQHSGLMSFLSRASTIGVMLGMTVLIVALSVINGFEQQLKTRLLSVVPHVSYQAPYDPIEDWPSKTHILAQFPGVSAAAPEINSTAMVQFKGKLQAAQLKAIEPQLHASVSSVGRFFQSTDLSALAPKELVLGKQIADKLGLAIGDKVTLLIANQKSDNPLAAPKRITVELVDLIEMGGPIDSTLALVHLSTVQKALGLDSNSVTGLRAKVDDVFDAHNIAMQAGRQLPDLVYVSSWFRAQGSLYQDIQMVRTIVYMVVFLIIAVASFNIISSMVIEVKDKQSDIAILKTMGAKDSTIFMTFALQGVMYAGIGALIGTVLGTVLAINLPDIFAQWVALTEDNPLQGVYFVEFLPSQLIWTDIVVSVAVTFVIAIAASIYPAWQATQTDPAKVLGN